MRVTIPLIAASLLLWSPGAQPQVQAGYAARTFTARITDTTVQAPPTKHGIPIKLYGRGRISFLGPVSEVGTGRQTPLTGGLLDHVHLVLAVTTGGAISARLLGPELFTRNGLVIVRKLRFTITGGTGRLARAAGQGTVRATCPNDPNASALTCTNVWKGTFNP